TPPRHQDERRPFIERGRAARAASRQALRLRSGSDQWLRRRPGRVRPWRHLFEPAGAVMNASTHERPITASDYIKENFEARDRIALLILNRETGESVQRITTAEKASSPEFQAWLRHRNATGDEIYVGMNALKQDSATRTKDQVATIRHLYIDLDHGGEEAIGRMR